MKKKFELKNCFGDVCELTLDMEQVKFIFRKVLSGDEIYIVVFNNNEVKKYDSDRHFRATSYFDDFEMIYPERISFANCGIEPNEEENFICIKENKKWKKEFIYC